MRKLLNLLFLFFWNFFTPGAKETSLQMQGHSLNEPNVREDRKAEAEALTREAYELLSTKKYEEALSATERVLRRDPTSTDGYFIKSKALLKLKKYDEAIWNAFIATGEPLFSLNPNLGIKADS